MHLNFEDKMYSTLRAYQNINKFAVLREYLKRYTKRGIFAV